MSSIRYDLEGIKSPYSTAKLLYITSAQSDTDWHSTPHTHAFPEMFYCLHGTGQFYVAGKYINTKCDDFIIINPSVEHTEIGTLNNPLKYVALGIEGVEFIFNGENQQPFFICNFKNRQNDIVLPLKMMLKEIELKREWNEALCSNLLEILLIHIFRSIDGEVIPSDGSDHKIYTIAKHYIDTHYSENITLDFLAEMMHLNKYYLAHAFVREYNISPINYLTTRRIRESKYLLANTNHSLSQISNILGFPSPGGFSRSFKRLENMTPWEYRKFHKIV